VIYAARHLLVLLGRVGNLQAVLMHRLHNQLEAVPLQRAVQRLVLHSFAQTSAKKDNDAQLSLHHGD
jgi:hypothetical protein